MDAPPVVVPPEEPPRPLEKLTYPLYVRLLAAVAALAFVAALVRAPRALAYGIDAEKGRRELAAGRYEQAAGHLGRVVKAFPAAKDVRMDYAEACLHSDLPSAVEALMWFEGKEVTKDEEERLNGIEAAVDAKITEWEKAEGKAK